ncbi:MAG: terminase small subunit protein [Pseudomonadota bacterium]
MSKKPAPARKAAAKKVPAKKTTKAKAAKPIKRAAAEPKKRGAPTKKTQEIMDTICQGVSVGKSARAMCVICNISQPSLWKWLAEDESFSKQYARAKEECADFIAEEILEIADDGKNDTYTDDKGNVCTNQDVIARSRLRVDARKWYASKLAPKKYGEKTTLAGDPESPLAVLMMDQIAANPRSRLTIK